MILVDLEICNFMAIKEAKIEFQKQGLVLVQGKNTDSAAFESNGAGKSNIFEAICWVFFDRTVRELEKDEVVNETSGKDCSVVARFIDDNGIEYKVHRYRNHKQFKNNVHITKEGKKIELSSTKETNNLIIDLIQMDYNTFINSVLFGQGVVKTFTNSTDLEKKEILEKMLRIDIFVKCLETTRRLLKDLNSELSNLVYKIDNEESLVEEITETINSLKEAEKEKTEESKREILRLTKELKTTKESLEEIETSDRSEKVNELKDKLNEIQEEIDGFSELKDKLSDLKSDGRSTDREIRTVLKEISRLTEEYENIENGSGTLCPVCSQEISEDSIQKSLEHVKEVMSEKIKERNKLNKALTRIEKGISKIEEALVDLDEVEELKETVKQELYELNAQIKEEGRQVKQLEDRIKSISRSLKTAKDDLKRAYKPLIDEKENQLKTVLSNVETLKENVEKIETKINKYEFWVKGFGNSGIKSFMLDNVTPFLNKSANKYLNKLTGGTVNVEFSTRTTNKKMEEREKFDVRLFNSVGGGSYKSNSTGERKRVDLSISLAFQDLIISRSNGKSNILLYDEVFDGLDSIGCENVIELLQEMNKKVESIFVITHNDILKSYFSNRLIAEKTNGVTKVYREG